MLGQDDSYPVTDSLHLVVFVCVQLQCDLCGKDPPSPQGAPTVESDQQSQGAEGNHPLCVAQELGFQEIVPYTWRILIQSPDRGSAGSSELTLIVLPGNRFIFVRMIHSN